jgi:hypothetical protein
MENNTRLTKENDAIELQGCTKALHIYKRFSKDVKKLLNQVQQLLYSY